MVQTIIMGLSLQISLFNKSVTLLLFCLFAYSGLSFAQEKEVDTTYVDRNIKYEFERYKGTKTTKIRQGDYIQITLKSADTTIVYFGGLLSLSVSEITINKDYTEKKINKDGTFYEESKILISPVLFTLPFSQIEFISKFTKRSEIGSFLGGAAFAGALFAPLACIDKNAESGFNAKRYVTIIKYAAVTAGAGIIAAIAFADYNRFTLKPKLISIEKK